MRVKSMMVMSGLVFCGMMTGNGYAQGSAEGGEAGATAPRSYLVGLGGKGEPPSCAVFEPVAQPEPLIAELLQLYRIGRSAPLLLLPRSSRRYVEDYSKARKDEEREKRGTDGAEKTYRGIHELRPDVKDPYIAQVFAELDPLATDFTPFAGGTFRELAFAVFGPLIEHPRPAGVEYHHRDGVFP